MCILQGFADHFGGMRRALGDAWGDVGAADGSKALRKALGVDWRRVVGSSGESWGAAEGVEKIFSKPLTERQKLCHNSRLC